MSRVAKAPISIPNGVDIKLNGNKLIIKGSKGQLDLDVHKLVNVAISENSIKIEWDKQNKVATAQAGTARALINNMVKGVSSGYERKLSLVGVGYRAQAKGSILNLSLGFSHPIDFEVPQTLPLKRHRKPKLLSKVAINNKLGKWRQKLGITGHLNLIKEKVLDMRKSKSPVKKPRRSKVKK